MSYKDKKLKDLSQMESLRLEIVLESLRTRTTSHFSMGPTYSGDPSVVVETRSNWPCNTTMLAILTLLI